MNKFLDIIFFLIIVAVPSSFFGLVRQDLFYVQGTFDLIMLGFVLSIPFYILCFKNIFLLKNLFFGKYLLILCLYEVLQIIFSILSNIPFSEVVTISRVFISPISTAGYILYFISISKERILRIFKWIILTTVIQGVFFILYHLTGINIFAVDIYMSIYYTGSNVYRYFLAYPMLNYLVFGISFVMVFYIKENKYLLMVCLIINFITMLLLSTRSTLIVFVFFIIISFLFESFINKKIEVKFIIILLMSATLIFFIFTFFLESYFSYFTSRFTDEFLYGKNSLTEASTFDYRLSLINSAYNSLDNIPKFLFGNGYIRYKSIIGQFDLAMQSDTPFASILYAEGISGLIFRFIPIIAILIYNLKIIKLNIDKYDLYLKIFIITFILSELFNIIQTNLLQNYNYAMLFIFAIQIYYLKRNNEIPNE